jgi:hypothetical protein
LEPPRQPSFKDICKACNSWVFLKLAKASRHRLGKLIDPDIPCSFFYAVLNIFCQARSKAQIKNKTPEKSESVDLQSQLKNQIHAVSNTTNVDSNNIPHEQPAVSEAPKYLNKSKSGVPTVTTQREVFQPRSMLSVSRSQNWTSMWTGRTHQNCIK